MFLKRGNIDREIVIGAHYDSVDTNGADDNASGVGLVLETANRIIDVETNYSVRFILFDWVKKEILEAGIMSARPVRNIWTILPAISIWIPLPWRFHVCLRGKF